MPDDPGLRLTNLTPAILEIRGAYAFGLAAGDGRVDVIDADGTLTVTIQVVPVEAPPPPPPPAETKYPHNVVNPKRLTLPLGVAEYEVEGRTYTAPNTWEVEQQSRWQWVSSNAACIYVNKGRITTKWVGDAIITMTRTGIEDVDTLLVYAREVARGAPSVFTVPSTIDRTGTQDVTQEFAQFLFSVPNGSTVRLDGGIYRLDEEIYQVDRRLTIEGPGELRQPVSEGCRRRKMLTFDGGGPIIIRGFTMQGGHPAPGNLAGAYNSKFGWGQHALRFGGVEDILVENMTIRGFWGDLITIGSEFGIRSARPRVLNNDLSYNGRQGIAVGGAHNVVIRGNRISQIARSAIDIEPSVDRESSAVDTVMIEQNDCNRSATPRSPGWAAPGSRR